MIDWELPLKSRDYGSLHLLAMLDEEGKYISLSSKRLPPDDQQHFRQQFGNGVRFVVHPEREFSRLIYYKADGTPWLDHHAPLTNGSGKAVPLSEMEKRAVEAAKEAEMERQLRRQEANDRMREWEAKQRQQLADAIVAEADAVFDDAQREGNPLWGLF